MESEGLGFNLCVAPSHVVVSLISEGKGRIGDRRFGDDFVCFGTRKTIGVKEVHLITNGFDCDVKMAEEISNFYCSTTPEII